MKLLNFWNLYNFILKNISVVINYKNIEIINTAIHYRIRIYTTALIYFRIQRLIFIKNFMHII